MRCDYIILGFLLASFTPHTHTMPTHTDHQLATDALHRAFLVNFITDLESQELDYSSDLEDDDSDDSMDGYATSSDSSATSSSSKSSSDGDDSDMMTPAETYWGIYIMSADESAVNINT